MSKYFSLVTIVLFTCVIAVSSCKKKDADDPGVVKDEINVESITEDNALDEADKLLNEVDKM